MTYFQKHTDFQNVQEFVIKRYKSVQREPIRLIFCENEMSLSSIQLYRNQNYCLLTIEHSLKGRGIYRIAGVIEP